MSTQLFTYVKYFFPLLVVFASTAYAPRVFSATVYSQLGTGFDVSSFQSYYAPAGADLPLSTTTQTHFVTLSSSVNKFQIPRPSSGCSVGTSLHFVDVNSGGINFNLNFTSPVDQGATCQYSFDGSGSYPSGTKFFGISNSTSTPAFYGSGSNDGGTYDDTSLLFNGGLAFQLCNSVCTDSFATGTPIFLTRIIDEYPPDGSVVATSTPVFVGADIYVTDSDFASSSDLVLRVTHGLQNPPLAGQFGSIALDPVLALWSVETEDYQVPASGFSTLGADFNFEDDIGIHYLKLQIIDAGFSILGINFGDDVLREQITRFTVGTTTPGDRATQGARDEFNEVFGTSTISFNAEACNFVSGDFEASACLSYLFIPDPQFLSESFQRFQNGFLSVWPFGYITRFVSILVDPTEIVPPPISYTFGSSSPAVLQGKNYSVQLYDHLGELESIRTDDGENKNIWDIVMPYWVTIVAIAVFLVIMEELLDIVLRADFTQFRGRYSRSDVVVGNEVTERNGDLFDGKRKIKINDYRNETDENFESMKRNRLI